MLFQAPAMPTRSSGRPHAVPLIDTPSDRLVSMSVKAMISLTALFQLKRPNRAAVAGNGWAKVERKPVFDAPLGGRRNGVVGGEAGVERGKRTRLAIGTREDAVQPCSQPE